MVTEYGTRIYAELNEINFGIKDAFHSSLSKYKNLYFKISNENVCQNFFAVEPTYNFTGNITNILNPLFIFQNVSPYGLQIVLLMSFSQKVFKL